MIKDKNRDKQDRLTFKWLKCRETQLGDFGDPNTASDYQLCVYDTTGLIAIAEAPAGGLCNQLTQPKDCWKPKGQTTQVGWKYKDKDARSTRMNAFAGSGIMSATR